MGLLWLYNKLMNKLLTILKSWYGVLFLVLLAGGVLWFVLNGMPYINTLRANWEAKWLQAQWEKPYREDKYGGKTPEETYDMFLDALRKGDTTLASKYFEIEKQSDWLKTLNEYQKNGILANFTDELESTEKIWKKSEKSDEEMTSFTYKVFIEKGSTATIDGQKIEVPPGEYLNETIFTKYPSGIWKITLL